MSLEFIDGFDHYTSAANMGLKWQNTQASTPGQAGRFTGSSAVQIVSSSFIFGSPGGTYVTLPALSTRYVGFAVQFSTDGGHRDSTSAFVTFADGYNIQCYLCFDNSTGLIDVRLGTGDALLGTLPGLYSPNVWYYFEVFVQIGAAGAGAVTVRVNGATQLTLTSVTTQSTGNSTFTTLSFGSYNNTVLIDDLYVLNTSGFVNNSFLGDCRVITGLPSADSTTNAAWTPNSGTTHFSRVDEANPDGDTTYNSSSTVGAIDTYQFPAFSSSASSIAGVQNVLTARKDDAGTRTLVSECRRGGVNYDGATQFSITSGYKMYRQILENDPNTASAWLFANLNIAEFGAKVIA